MSVPSGPQAHLHGVILAGGRGTRFWPRSRRRFPKQLLNVVGDGSLLQQTVGRLRPLIPPDRIWVFTRDPLRQAVARQLPQVPRHQIIAEPVQRNTGPCIALAARLLLERDPDAIMGVFPSDHVIGKVSRYLTVLRSAARVASRGKLVVLGIQPKWPETGYGYIEFPRTTRPGGLRPHPVVRFREKPQPRAARRFVAAGHYGWNSGTFFWRADVIREAVGRFMPATAAKLEKIVPLRSRKFRRSLGEHYPCCDDQSIDYGVLEKAHNLVGISCPDVGWSDVGSWEAVYRLLVSGSETTVERTPHRSVKAAGNYVDAPGKLVALIGVRDLIVVDSPDALLVCHRGDAQQVSTLVETLENAGEESLL